MKNRLDAAPLNQLLHIALFESGINFWMSKGPWDTNHINSLSKLLVCRVLLSEPCHTILADEHFAPQIILLPGTLCIPTPFADTLYSLTRTLLISTLCTSAQFDHRSTLLPKTFLSLKHLTPWNTLVLVSREQKMLRRTIYKLAKCSREKSIPRSRVFQEAKCAEKQSVLGSKVFQGEECWGKSVSGSNMWKVNSAGEQSVRRSKVFLRANCSSAQSYYM